MPDKQGQKPAKPRPQSSQSRKQPQYEYFTDEEGRVKRFRKFDQTQEYQKRPGYIRFRFLQKYYIWWKRKSFDFKLMILPWFLGFFACYVIYKFSMTWSQNDLERQIKAKLNFDLNKETIQKMKQLRNESSSEKDKQLL